MKRARDTGDDGGRPVSGTAKEEIDVSHDSDEEAPKTVAPNTVIRVTVVNRDRLGPGQRIDVVSGTPFPEFRTMLFGLVDDNTKSITFIDRQSDECEMTATRDLKDLFDLAAEEAKMRSCSTIIAKVYVATRGGGGGAHGGGHGPVNGIVGGPGQGNRIRVFGKLPPGTPLVPGGLLGQRSLSELKDQIYQALLSGELSVEYFQDRAGYVGADGTIMLGKGGIVHAWSAPALRAKLHSLILFVEAARSNPSVRPQ